MGTEKNQSKEGSKLSGGRFGEILAECDLDAGRYIDDIHIMSEKQSLDSWSSLFGAAKHNFDPLVGQWKQRFEWVNLAGWIESYNCGERDSVSSALAENVGWDADERCIFYSGPLDCIEISWAGFAALWMEFVEMNDDGPMLVPQSCKAALQIVPVGFFCLGSFRS